MYPGGGILSAMLSAGGIAYDDIEPLLYALALITPAVALSTVPRPDAIVLAAVRAPTIGICCAVVAPVIGGVVKCTGVGARDENADPGNDGG